MIIQCKKCETKFRFDEAAISGEGVWVRCRICKDIFFQDNPAKEKTGTIPPGNGEKGGESVLAAEPVVVREERRAALVEALPSESSGLESPEPEFPRGGFPATAEESFSEEDEEDFLTEAGRKRPGYGKLAAYLLLLVLVIGGVSLWLFSPSVGQGLSLSLDGQAISQWASSLPLVEKILGGSPAQKDFSIGQVALQDLKQRVVKNMLLGDLRVMEGTALNRSPHVISRIQVRGRMYDAAGVVLGEHISFCGNILTDEELASLTEDGMQKMLSLPQGRNTSNERIMADDRIPFMIVFANVPPVLAKITALPLSAERLLP